MRKQIDQLLEFSNAFGSYYKKYPSTDVPSEIVELRIKLMKEELEELVEAVQNEPLENIAKELSDILYVLLGIVMAYGLQDKFEEIFTAVHKSNMSKLGEDGKPIHREDGKIIKSKNYKKPDIRSIIRN